MPEAYVHGVTGTTLRPKLSGDKNPFRSKSGAAVDADNNPFRPRKPAEFAANTALIEENQLQQESLQRREEQKKEKGPAWKRILKSPVAKGLGKALQYTSASEIAYKIPGIGDDLEAAADYIPGVRTALAIASNPLTYATGGVGGGLAAAAGAGIGAYALSDRDRGLGLDIPGVSEKYEETVGGALGGIAGAGALRTLRVRNARAAAANAESQLQRMEAGSLQAGDILHTADGKTFAPRRITGGIEAPQDGFSIRVKNPANYNLTDENVYRHASAGMADDIADAAAAADDVRPLSQATRERLASQIDDADVISAAVEKPSRSDNVWSKVGGLVDDVSPFPGFGTLKKIDRGIGQGVGKLVPDALEPVVSTLARPSVMLGATAALNPQKTKELIKQALQIDHAIGLKIAQTILPHWELDVDIPDWLPVLGPKLNLDLEGVGAELFRPSNLINFTPVGKGLQGLAIVAPKLSARIAAKTIGKTAAQRVLASAAAKGMSKEAAEALAKKFGERATARALSSGAAKTSKGVAAKALGEIAIREGAGNAVFGGLDAWSNGASKEQMLQAMAISFGAGAALGAPLNIGMPVAQHHLGRLWTLVKESPEGEEAKVLLTAHKNLEAEAPPAPEAPKAPTTEAVSEEFADVNITPEQSDNLNRRLSQTTSGPIDGGGWIEDTFDGIRRREVDSTQYGQVFAREDGTFDFLDSRWADIRNGPTKGAGQSIRNFPDFESARVELEELTARFSKSPEARLEDFKSDAARTLDEEGALFAERQARPEEFPSGAQGVASPFGELPPTPRPVQSDIISEAETVARQAEQPRVITEAERVAAGEAVPAAGNRLATVIARTNTEGGATFDIKTGDFVPYEGNFVGGLAPTVKVPFDELTPDVLERYVADNFDVAFSRPDVHLGTEVVEVDGQRVVNLDAVEVVADQAEAFSRAAERGEERIWSTAENRAIETPGVEQTQRNLAVETRAYDYELADALDRETIDRVELTGRDEPAKTRFQEADEAEKALIDELAEESGQTQESPRARAQAVAEAVKPSTREAAENVRASYYDEKRGKYTVAEEGDAESSISYNALENGTKVEGTDKTIASLNENHSDIIERMSQMPSVAEYLNITTRAVDTAHRAFESTVLAPEPVDVTYGGNLLDRTARGASVFTNQGQFNTTPGARGAGTGNAMIQTDLLAIVRETGRVFSSENITPEDVELKNWLARTIGKSYTEEDLLAARLSGTVFHEMVHRTVLHARGDAEAFFNAIQEFRRASSNDVDNVFNEYREAINKWKASGELDKLKELADAAHRIDFTSRTIISRPKVEPSSIRNALGSDVETRASSTGDSGIPEPVRERVGEDVPDSQQDAGTRGSTSGADIGRTTPESTRPSRTVNRLSLKDIRKRRLAAYRSSDPKTANQALNDRIFKERAEFGAAPRAQATKELIPGTTRVTRKITRAELAEKLGDDAEILESYKVANEKVTIKDGGPGKAFWDAQTDDGTHLVRPLPDLDVVIRGNFVDNVMSKIGKTAAKNKFANWVATTVGGKSAVAASNWQKLVGGYHILMVMGRSRNFLALNPLRIAKSPFKAVITDSLDSGRVHIKTVSGENVTVNIDDVWSNPSKYDLTDGQKTYIGTIHRIIDESVTEMKAHGIDIRDLGLEKRGEHYIPRFVKGVEGDWEPDLTYVKHGLNRTAAFQKHRYHLTMADGQAAGNIYAHPAEALEMFLDQATRKVAGKKLLDALEPYGTTGKKLALAEVGSIAITKFNKKLGKNVTTQVFKPIVAATAELKKAKVAMKQAAREVEAARRGGRKMKGGTGNRKLATRELTSMANELPEVKAARKALDDAKERKAVNKADIDVQSPVDMKLEAAFKKAKDTYDALLKKSSYKAPSIPKEQIAAAHKKMVDARNALATDNIKRLGSELNDAMASGRAQIRAAHNIGRGVNINVTGRTLVDAQARFEIAKEKFARAKTHSANTARKMQSITKRLSSAQTAHVSMFGLQGDIVKTNAAGEARLSGSNVMGLQGKLYPEEIAKGLSEALAQSDIGGVFRFISDVNNYARLARTSTDFGALLIQGLPVLFTHPHAFAKTMYQSILAMFDPEGYAKWLDSKRHVTNDMYEYAGGFSGNDYFTATEGNFIKQGASLHNIRGNPKKMTQKALGFTAQRFAISFEAFLDASKVNMWEGFMKGNHFKGADAAEIRLKKEAYGRFIRNMVGTTDTARLGISGLQRHIEALLLFSPRFTRSIFATIAQGAEGGPARGAALASMGALMGGAVLLFAAVKTALYASGQSEEPFSWQDLDPTQGGRFMSVKIGDNWIGLGGSMRGAIQLAANIATAEPGQFVSLKSTGPSEKANPFLKFARGKLSPFGGSAYDAINGDSVIGEDFSDRKLWLAQLPDQFLPFAAETLTDTEGGMGQRFAAFGATGVGMRSFPESSYDNLNARVQELAKDKSISGWSSLTSQQKVDMLDKHPELRQLIDKAETKNWSDYREITDQALSAKAALAQRWIATQAHGGTKLTEDDVTSKDYRDQLEIINAKIAGARAAANGADAVTGLGGTEFNGKLTARQLLMKHYYSIVDKNMFIRPDGTVDYDAKEALEGQFLASLTPAERAIVAEETVGSSYDPLENRLKKARAELRPYWDLYDEVAAEFGYPTKLAVQGAAEGIQKAYNKALDKAQGEWRRANPEADAMLKLWGYTSKTMDEKKGSRSKGRSLARAKKSDRLVRVSRKRLTLDK